MENVKHLFPVSKGKYLVTCMYVYPRVVLRSSEKYLSRSSKLLEINATDIGNEKIVNFASVARGLKISSKRSENAFRAHSS